MKKEHSSNEKSSRLILGGHAKGKIIFCPEGLSFWGGVDPNTGIIIDVHHPNHGDCISGKCLLMPTSRGSCSGSGVLLELILNQLGPTALIFREPEQILTLGAIVSDLIFDIQIPVIYLSAKDYEKTSLAESIELKNHQLILPNQTIGLSSTDLESLNLSEVDRSFLRGDHGPAAKAAIETICVMAAVESAQELITVKRGHIDGCILAHNANLIFAEKMVGLGAKITIPTTINAISVDRENWRNSGISSDFGERASRLADAYTSMGVKSTFTCAPYLLNEGPVFGENIGWSESNAVVFANTVIGARTQKHPDYLDLFIAMTGRAPASGVYSPSGRKAKTNIHVDVPTNWDPDDEVLWPLLGWILGRHAPDHIPLVTGLEHLNPNTDDLKALCAAFGTTSGAPMLHIFGHTPEALEQVNQEIPIETINQDHLQEAWYELNRGVSKIDLVAIGSPHASIDELRRLVVLFGNKKCHANTQMIITTARSTIALAEKEEIIAILEEAGVKLMPDLCWCSIIEPIFPPNVKGLMTNSGKYAHYAHGLSNRHSKLGSLKECVNAALTGFASTEPPQWLI